MGRKGSKLIPFLKEALQCKKYCNLKYDDVSQQVFSLNLPRKSPRLDESSQLILQDWYSLKNREYKFKIDYSEGKQGMEAALKRSDFLQPIKSVHKKLLVYKILDDDSISEKKTLKKEMKRKRRLEYINDMTTEPLEVIDSAPSSVSSGYSSGSVESPQNPFLACESDDHLQDVVEHKPCIVRICPTSSVLSKYSCESADVGFDSVSSLGSSELGIGQVEDLGEVSDCPLFCGILSKIGSKNASDGIEEYTDLEKMIKSEELLPPLDPESMDFLKKELEGFPENFLENSDLNDFFSQNDVEPMQVQSSQGPERDDQLRDDNTPDSSLYETQMCSGSS